MSETNLQLIIEAAKNGDEMALDSLSKIALGGNEAARTAIAEIEGSDWQPTSDKSNASAPTMVWPLEVESGQRGPKRGDIPDHFNV